MISSVELHNWKTHAKSEFSFGKGTNVLIGPMGAGKTAVMDAVCFALFGTFPALQGRRIALDEVIQNKPNRAEGASVKLCFDYAGKQYVVERAIKRKGSTEAKLYCDSRFIAGPKPSDVNSAVERALEINYNLFSRAVYSEQNEIDYFLRLSPGERKQRFDELLDLRKYETVRTNAVAVLNRIKGMARDRTGLLQQQKSAFKPEEGEKIRARIADKEKENAELREKICGSEKKERGLQEELGTIEKMEKEFNRLRESLSKTAGRAEELESAVAETKKEAKGRTAQELHKEKKLLQEEAQKKEKEIAEAEGEKEKERKAAGEAEKAIGVNERRGKELREHLLQLKGFAAVCPVCRRALESKTKQLLLDENEAEQEKLSSENSGLLKRCAEIEKKIKQADEKIRHARAEKEKIAGREIELKQIELRLEALAEKEKLLQRLATEAEKAGKELREIAFDPKDLSEKRKMLFEQKASIDGMRKSIRSNEELGAELLHGLRRIEEAGRQITQLEAKIAIAEKSAEKLGFFVNSLQDTQNQLRLTLVQTINEAMESIWLLLYPYGDFVSAKMDVEEGSYELKAKTRGGEWVRVEGILSGGERSAAAICIRIAFSLVLTQNLGWLILDEPTHNLDARAIGMLSGMMQGSLPGMVEQIFVITHDNEMKKAASATLYLLERDKDNDAATRPVAVPIGD